MTKTFNISLPEKLVSEIDRRAKEENRSRSELIRTATISYLDWWKSWESLRKERAKRARKLGIKPSDIPRLVAEVRQGK